MPRHHRLLGLHIAFALVAGSPRAQAPAFTRDVLPLLADRCFKCHGPDEHARKAKLRLDRREDAVADRGGYAAVVPGQPEASALLARIGSADPDERMPPPESKLSLTAAEIATLRAWIADGAEWAPHWAFVPPVRPALPAVHDGAWPRNEIDRFVLAPLEGASLRPSPPADPATLLRRVSLDLTGLPPSPEELAAFLAAPTDAAYERAVDLLLASPRYGERMAWEWLQASRYADTDGFQSDPTRSMWPWRDWLVEALNANVPFDRFTELVLAGDLLPDATPEQTLASGFHRNHAYNGEGGRIAEETRVENVFDRAETTATVWLGLTLECARCHDHKFDPITQREYYQLFAFFDQTSESGAAGSGRAPPVLRYLPPAEREALAQLEQRVAAASQALQAPDPGLDAAEAAWAESAGASLRTRVGEFADVTLGPWSRLGPLQPPAGGTTGAFAAVYGPEQGVDLERSYETGAQRWRPAPELRDGAVQVLPEIVGATFLYREIEAPCARTLTVSLGSDDGLQVWCNGTELLAKDVQRAAAADQELLPLPLRAGRNTLLLKVVNTGGPAGFYFDARESAIDGLPATLVRALLAPAAARDASQSQAVRAHFRRERSPAFREGEQARDQLAAEIERRRAQAPSVMVMDSLPRDRQRTTRVLERGNYAQPREPVAMGTPAFLPPLPQGAPRDRLTLARWLCAGDQPLTARVAANRSWQLFFGRGLVATGEDFGRQGRTPSHPLLLDWLARTFVDSGWDVKALHRLIVTSATYRQTAQAPPKAWRDDPDNVALARGPRFRLASWLLRDQALALGGLLVEQRGGPPVKPYQPDGVWSEATFGQIRYQRDKGPALYRRSLYVFWRRIVGPTMFFDEPARQACVVRRSVTNTPLHALTTLNDVGFVEAARAFGARATREGGADPRARIAWAFRAATARPPDDAELERLLMRFEQSRAQFARDPAAATALLAVGDTAPAAGLPPDELAAYAVVASILLNLDEVLSRP